MKKFIGSILMIVFVFSLSINLVGAQTLSNSSIANILNSLLKANLIPAQSLQTAKSMLGNYSAYSQTYCYGFNRDLTIGATGQDVVELQTFLENMGLLVLPDGPSFNGYPPSKGYFGTLTAAALAKYQASIGISPADGYFGPITRAAITSGCGSGFSTSTEPMLITNVVSENVEVIKSDNSKTTNIKYNYVLDLTAVNGDIYVPSTMKWSLPNSSENITDGLVIALQKDEKVISPSQNASISWGQYTNNIEYDDSTSSYFLREGYSTKIQLSVETGDLSESGNYRVSLVGFVYRDRIDGGVIKQHIIRPGEISSQYVYINSNPTNTINVNSPADGTVYDGGPREKITTKWSKYEGYFDYYRVTLSNGVVGNDPVLKSRINKKTNEYTITSKKLQEIMRKNWKRTNFLSYFMVEAIKKVKGKETVVASGMKGVFSIKDQSNNLDSVIKITSPNNGIQVKRNTELGWAWTSATNLNEVDVYLLKDGQKYAFAKNYPNNGSFWWAAGYAYSEWGLDLENGEYSISVCPSGSSISNKCGTFSFTLYGDTPVIEIVYPEGGEVYFAGDKIDVSFTGAKIGEKYQIRLLYPAMVSPVTFDLGTVISDTNGQVNYRFVIPSYVPYRKDYTVEVVQLTNDGTCLNTCALTESKPFVITQKYIEY